MTTPKPLYERAREAGAEARAKQLSELSTAVFTHEQALNGFVLFMCKEQPGTEAAWRQFAVAFDPRNKRWAEGNDD